MGEVWASSPDAIKRPVERNTPRGWAYCERCGERLDYECGSIHWQCVEVDLCPKHWADRIVENVVADLKAKAHD